MSHAAGEAAWHWNLETGRIDRGGALLPIAGFSTEEAAPDFAWWRERIHPEDRASVLAAIDAAVSGERRELVLLYRFLRRDGTHTLLLDRAFVLGGPEGRPERLVGFVREVGEPTAVEESISQGLVASVEDERKRVSQELHDEIGQLLTALRIHLRSGSSERASADEILDELFARVRDISTSLRPPMLDDLGLGPALSWYCQRFTARTGVDVNLMISGLDRRYAPSVELVIFRVIQESLTNIARHAATPRARVAVRGGSGYVKCLVLDQGKGFHPQQVGQQASGLTGMRGRAASVGGRLFLSSIPGRGTRISLMIPIRREAPPSSDEVQHG